jgi:hypothetical protein
MIGQVSCEMAAAKHSLVPGKSKLIIKAVLDEHLVHSDDFFGRGKLSYLVAARRDAAHRLLAAGYNPSQVGRFMRRHPSTVLNYFPKLVEAKRAQYAAKRVMRWLTLEAHETVIAVAKAENVTPEVLMARWVGERAACERHG